MDAGIQLPSGETLRDGTRKGELHGGSRHSALLSSSMSYLCGQQKVALLSLGKCVIKATHAEWEIAGKMERFASSYILLWFVSTCNCSCIIITMPWA